MSNATGDFPGQEALAACRQLAQQAWQAWLHAMPGNTPPMPAGIWPGAGAGGGADALLRGFAGLKQYLDWMQGVSCQVPPPFANVAASAAPLPFDASFWAGMTESLGQAWNAFGENGNAAGNIAWQPMAPLGLWRGQQREQDALIAAAQECAETMGRYQTVWQKIMQGASTRLAEKLARRAESGTPTESLRALYDTWVDAAEESFAEIALSVEFREAYGALSNAQMKLRALQQKQLEAWCRELGLPTREELASLGQRVQELRRELRGQGRKRRSKSVQEPSVVAQARTSADETVVAAPVSASSKQAGRVPAVAAAKQPAAGKPVGRRRAARKPALKVVKPVAAARKHVAEATMKKKAKRRAGGKSGRPSVFAQALAQQRRPVRTDATDKRRRGKQR